MPRDHAERVEAAVRYLRGVPITSRLVALAAGVTIHRARTHLDRLADAGAIRLVARTAPGPGRYGRVVVNVYEAC